MKAVTRIAAIALLLAAASFPAAASVEKHKDWDKSPEYVLLATDQEKTAWKSVATDADAETFLALFWAKRDPDLKTPANEFRLRFEKLVATADETFKTPRVRGALTERGKAFILIGPPKRIGRRDASAESGPLDESPPGSPISAPLGSYRTLVYTFQYEKEQLPPWAGLKSFEANFEVDEGRERESVRNSGAVYALEKKGAEAALVHPELKEPPVYRTREQAEAEQKAATAAAADAAAGPALTPPVRTSLEGLYAKPPGGALTVLPIAFRDGATRLMAQIALPATAVPAPEAAKLALLVKAKDGKDAARIEEAAGLSKSKGDLYASRAIALEAGDYDVAAALLDASGGVLASGRRPVTVTALSAEFSSSLLLLASNDLEADLKKPDDPFVFSGRRFIAKPEARFDAKDGLIYAIRVYNPAVDAAKKSMFLKRSLKIKPKNGPAIDVPGSAEQPTPVPEMKDKGTLVIDLAGSIVDENLGEYFRPGEYELRVTIADQVSGKKLDVSAPFTLSGTLKPPAPAAAAPKK